MTARLRTLIRGHHRASGEPQGQGPRTAVLLATLLALAARAEEPVPVGGEFLINSYTSGAQQQPALAIEPDGDFVVVWHSNGTAGTDQDSYSVQAQRFTSDGSAAGDQFQVNTYTTSRQGYADVGLDADGDFVVVWQSDGSPGPDGSLTSIMARRFTSDGTALGGEFQVNTYTTNQQELPAVGVDADGDFVVVWQSAGSGGTDTEALSVQARRFASDGTALDDEQQVNSYTTSFQGLPTIAVEPDGDFVVAWTSYGSGGTDTSDLSVQLQRFDSGGAAVGDELQVNTYTFSSQVSPGVAVEADGDFVVAWSSDGSSGTDTSIYSIQVQRFDSGGAAVGDQFQVNTYTTNSQRSPTVGFDDTGDFVVTWMSFGSAESDNSDYSVQIQRFNSGGAPLGGEVQVNTYITGFQHVPVIGVDSEGNFVVVWESTGSGGPDTSSSSIQGQRYSVLIFSDGFESGDTTAWSATLP